MLVKVLGALLLLAGILLALKYLFWMIWVIGSLALMLALLYFGWRLLKRDSS
ncbi:MAG: hypothetical protein QGH25_18655 [Candidatus Latescibacteria bacterium]|jgi:hypothetical protein|nr:hypothetical protein [Candidatus Latescibacterota bacterium]